MAKVEVYGADWCEDTQRTRSFLQRVGVDYDYVNIEEDGRAARWVREQNEGKERKPTVKVGRRVLSTPGDAELEKALREESLLS